MPRLNSSRIKRVIFYLFRTEGDRHIGPSGTGFFVQRRSHAVAGLSHIYAVTNQHVTQNEKIKASSIRLNCDNASRFLDFSQHQWLSDAQDDLSAIDVTEYLRRHGDEFDCVEENGQFVTQGVVDEFFLDIGEDVIMVGLFSSHYGGDRNKPTARFGNISMMPDPNALIEQPNGVKRPSYLVDTRSRGGYSGSPVFVFRTPTADLRYSQRRIDPNSHHIVEAHRNVLFGLLGIHCAQYPESVCPLQSIRAEGDQLVKRLAT